MFSRADHGQAQRALSKDDRLLRENEVSEMLGVAIATLPGGDWANPRPSSGSDVPYGIGCPTCTS
jgi:hypothetical protein